MVVSPHLSGRSAILILFHY